MNLQTDLNLQACVETVPDVRRARLAPEANRHYHIVPREIKCYPLQLEVRLSGPVGIVDRTLSEQRSGRRKQKVASRRALAPPLTRRLGHAVIDHTKLADGWSRAKHLQLSGIEHTPNCKG